MKSHFRIIVLFYLILSNVLLAFSLVRAQDSLIYWFDHQHQTVYQGNIVTSDIDTLFSLRPRQPLAFDIAGENVYWVDDPQEWFSDDTVSVIWVGDPHKHPDARILRYSTAFVTKLIADHKNGQIYWLERQDLQEYKTGVIRKIDVESLAEEELITEEEIYTFSVDTMHQKLYWASQQSGAIIRSESDGNGKDTVLTGFRDVHDIAVDATNEVLYWSGRPVGEETGHGIYRAGLDGEEVARLADLEYSGQAVSLAPDFKNNRLYWSEPEIIKSIDPDTDESITILQDSKITGFALRFHPAEERLYWLKGEALFFPQRSIVSIAPDDPEGEYVREELVGFGRATSMTMDTEEMEIFWTTDDRALYATRIDEPNIRSLRYGSLALSVQEKQSVVLNRNSGLLYLAYHFPLETPSTFNRLQRCGSGFEQLGHISEFAAREFAFNPFSDMIYWFGFTAPHGFVEKRAIFRTNENDPANRIEKLIGDEALRSGVGGLAMDMNAWKLYWTESGDGTIRRMDADGNHIEDLISGLEHPYGLSLDVENGKMYWSQRGSGMIRRARLDGSNIEDLFTGLNHPARFWLSFENSGIPNYSLITSDPSRINFGTVTVGESKVAGFTIKNSGFDDLEVNISLSGPDAASNSFELSETSFSLPPDSNRIVNVIFSPNRSDSLYAFVDIEHNARNAREDEIQILLSGFGRTGTNVDNSESLPGRLLLKQNYPNPFNPSTRIRYALPESAHVTVEVFDITGRQVATLVDRLMPAGEHAAVFDAAGLSSGIYVYRISAYGYSLTRRMTLVR